MAKHIEPTTETNVEANEDFHITDEAGANWFLRKLANIEAEKARVQAQAAQIVKQLEADAETLRYLYESQLQEYVRQELAKRGNRRKSLPLLQGTCQFRTVPATVKIADTTAAMGYVLETGADAIKRTVALDTEKYRELAQAALQNGELLPGVENVPEHQSFAVKFGKTGD